MRALAVICFLCAVVGARALTPLEGTWRFDGVEDPDDEAVIDIRRVGNGAYEITSVRHPDLYVVPGAVLGTATVTNTATSEYRFEMGTGVDRNGRPDKYKTFNAVVKNQGYLQLTPVKSNFKLDLWMLYRFMFTVSARKNRKEPAVINAVRTDLPNPENPLIL